MRETAPVEGDRAEKLSPVRWGRSRIKSRAARCFSCIVTV